MSEEKKKTSRKTTKVAVTTKRRGRKPKDNTYSAVISTPTSEPEKENVILHLPIHSKDIDKGQSFAEDTLLKYTPNLSEPLPYEPLTNTFAAFNEEPINETIEDKEPQKESKHPEIDSSEIQGAIEPDKSPKCRDRKVINIMFEFIDANKKDEWPERTDVWCKWCSHPFNSPPCAIPEKYVKGIFYLTLSGCFCSYNCAAAQIFADKEAQMWEKYSLLNMMYSKINNTKSVKIKLAPPRETLTVFGGTLSIDDFRASFLFNNTMYTVLKPPMISIVPQIEESVASQEKAKFVPINNSALESILKKQKQDMNLPAKTLSYYMDLKVAQ